MKKLALITIAVIYGLGQLQLQAQTDTTHYGDSWIWVEPLDSKVGKMVTKCKSTKECGHWDTVTNPWPQWIIDSIVDARDIYWNIYGTFAGTFYGFPYSDTVSQTIYGIAIPMLVYDLDTDWYWKYWKETQHIDEKNVCGRREGDSGIWAGITKPVKTINERNEKIYVFEESVRLGPKMLTDEIDKLIGGTGQLRRTCFMYDYDTTEPEMYRHDTVELLEMYFDKPYEYKAGDTIYASYLHNYPAGYDLATRIIFPFVADHPKLKTSKYKNKRQVGASGYGGLNGEEIDISVTDDTLYGGNPGTTETPQTFPIIKLRCSTPRDWSMTTAADSAVLTWQHFDGAEGYELMVNNITQCDSSVLLISDPDAVQHTLQGLDSNSYYHVRLRKLCRYATPTYDTIVPSDWTEVFTIGNPTPPCDTTDTTIVDTTIVDTTGIHLAGSLRLELQPNPASDMVELTLDAPDGGRLTLTDLAGREVLQMAIPAPTTTLHLDIHTLPAGAYMLKVSTPNGTASRRLLVQ